MPVRINEALPAYGVLTHENIFVMTEQRASTQDIRPLKIAILNIMPTKIITETQLLRLLGNTPLQVDITLLYPSTHQPKNTTQEHLNSFYRTFQDIREDKYDGLIITGAPVEQMPFEEVNYWQELSEIFEWAKTNVYSTMYICWGAQAGLYYHYGLQKELLPKKLSGVYRHTLTGIKDKLLRGFDDVFDAPHSRYTGVDTESIRAVRDLKILAESREAGAYLISGRDGRDIYVTGHPEYDPLTLQAEYRRDMDRGINPDPPENYFEDNNPLRRPVVRWRGHANLLFSNWLNYCVYQETPFKIEDIR